MLPQGPGLQFNASRAYRVVCGPSVWKVQITPNSQVILARNDCCLWTGRIGGLPGYDQHCWMILYQRPGIHRNSG